MRTRGRLLPFALALLIAACAAGPVDPGEPTADPVVPVPDPVAPAADPGDPPTDEVPSDGDGPSGELPPLVADWEDDFLLVLPNGWTVSPCDGDAPLLCFADGDRRLGVVEVAEYPIAADAADDPSGYLAEQAEDFVTGMRQDRGNGCPHLRFEANPTTAVEVGGEPGLRAEFRLVDERGVEAERHIVYWTVHDGAHLAINAAAYGVDGCMERLGEFSPTDLGRLDDYLDRIVEQTPLPD